MQKVDPDAIMNAASADSADSTPTLEETAADAKPPGRKIWTCSMGDDCAYKVHNGRDGKVFAATSDHEVYSAFFRRVMPALLNFAVGSETGPKDLESEVICIHCAAALMKQMIADKKNLEDERICGELNGTTVTIRYPDARPVKLQALGKTIGWLVSEQEKHEAASNAIAERLGSKLAERGNRRGNRGNRRPRQTAKPAAAAPTKPPQRTIEEALADSRNEEAPATAAPAPYVSALDQLATLAVNPEGDLEGDKATIWPPTPRSFPPVSFTADKCFTCRQSPKKYIVGAYFNTPVQCNIFLGGFTKNKPKVHTQTNRALYAFKPKAV